MNLKVISPEELLEFMSMVLIVRRDIQAINLIVTFPTTSPVARDFSRRLVELDSLPVDTSILNLKKPLPSTTTPRADASQRNEAAYIRLFNTLLSPTHTPNLIELSIRQPFVDQVDTHLSLSILSLLHKLPRDEQQLRKLSIDFNLFSSPLFKPPFGHHISSLTALEELSFALFLSEISSTPNLQVLKLGGVQPLPRDRLPTFGSHVMRRVEVTISTVFSAAGGGGILTWLNQWEHSLEELHVISISTSASDRDGWNQPTPVDSFTLFKLKSLYLEYTSSEQNYIPTIDFHAPLLTNITLYLTPLSSRSRRLLRIYRSVSAALPTSITDRKPWEETLLGYGGNGNQVVVNLVEKDATRKINTLHSIRGGRRQKMVSESSSSKGGDKTKSFLWNISKLIRWGR